MVMHKSFRPIILATIFSILAITAIIITFLIILTVLEYRPKEIESVDIMGKASSEVQVQKPIKIFSWNIGYADLGDYADFFMDGGAHVQNSSREQIEQNIEAFISEVKKQDADIVLLQEVDLASSRSYKINQVSLISNSAEGFCASFAYNFKSAFVPYPIPPIGKVESGLFTLSTFASRSAARFSLPVPFKWPVKTANLKRCLLVNRLPLKNSNKQLIIVNLHLEAFDSGAGRIEQTQKLKDFVLSEYKKGNYVIAGGDFNQTFSNTDISFYYQRPYGWKPGLLSIEDFPSDWNFLQDSTVPTCRSNRTVYKGRDKSTFQFFCIDGFITSPNISVSSIKTLDLNFVNSDHNPVVLTCTLSKE